LPAGKNFSADRKLFVILRVFVVDWAGLYDEDAKNRQVFGCGWACAPKGGTLCVLRGREKKLEIFLD